MVDKHDHSRVYSSKKASIGDPLCFLASNQIMGLPSVEVKMFVFGHKCTGSPGYMKRRTLVPTACLLKSQPGLGLTIGASNKEDLV
jgi:hypothetical protein